MPEAEITTNGPCRPFSFFDSSASRTYCRRRNPNGSSLFERYARVSSSKHSGCARCTAVTFNASGLSTKIGMFGIRFSFASWCNKQDKLLCTPHGKGGHDDPAAAPGRAVDDLGKFVGNVPDLLVKLSAVGAFKDQHVTGGSGSGSRTMGSPGRPISPEYPRRTGVAPDESVTTMLEDPRICPASTDSKLKPGAISNGCDNSPAEIRAAYAPHRPLYRVVPRCRCRGSGPCGYSRRRFKKSASLSWICAVSRSIQLQNRWWPAWRKSGLRIHFSPAWAGYRCDRCERAKESRRRWTPRPPCRFRFFAFASARRP